MKVTYIDHMGTDLSVVNAARVSFRKRSSWEFPALGCGLSDRDKRLIHFLGREQHLSPFNHTFMTMHCHAPLFVARQLVKHEYMPWNEVSGRYVTFEPEFHEHEVYRAKAADKKQGSGEPLEDQHGLKMLFDQSHQRAFDDYADALHMGLCEEQARCLLPLDLMTEWYWSGTLGAWAKMFNLRTHDGVQLETEQMARNAGRIAETHFPESWKALTQ